MLVLLLINRKWCRFIKTSFCFSLVCAVSYTTQGGEKMYFRKFFKFQVLKMMTFSSFNSYFNERIKLFLFICRKTRSTWSEELNIFGFITLLSALHMCRFCVHRFNQAQNWNHSKRISSVSNMYNLFILFYSLNIVVENSSDLCNIYVVLHIISNIEMI